MGSTTVNTIFQKELHKKKMPYYVSHIICPYLGLVSTHGRKATFLRKSAAVASLTIYISLSSSRYAFLVEAII